MESSLLEEVARLNGHGATGLIPFGNQATISFH